MTTTIHTGYTLYDGVKTWYFVDDVDNLDCEIRGYERWDDIDWQRIQRIARSHEATGDRIYISVKELFYETP